MEIWKDILDYEGIYRISNYGNVKSLERQNEYLNYTIRERQLKPGLVTGYPQVVLNKSKIKNQCKIHRLVALAFISNPENKPCINHKNGIKNDNRVENLEWVTYSENTIHAWKIGLNSLKNCSIYKLHGFGENSSSNKLTQRDANNIRKEYLSRNYTYRELSKKYNVGISSIGRVVKYENWNG